MVDKLVKEEAREALEVAIKNYLVVTELMDAEEEMVNHWFVLGHMQRVIGNDTDTYFRIQHKHNVPRHIYRGLLAEGSNGFEE